MKKFSKILSVALLVALVLSLGVANAFAASITINRDDSYSGTGDGNAYQYYKVFSADTEVTTDSETGTSSITSASYFATSAVAAKLGTWVEAVGTPGADGYEAAHWQKATGNLWFDLTPIAGSNPQTYNVTWVNDSEEAATVQAAAEWLLEKQAYEDGPKDLTFADGKWTSGTIANGYYIVKGATGNNLIAATSDISINEKNTYPPLDKTQADEDNTTQNDNSRDVAVGDVLNYEVKVTIPATAKVGDQILVWDKPTTGLTYNNDVAVKSNVGNATVAEATPEAGQAWARLITVTAGSEGKDVVFEFSMTVNSTALTTTKENESGLKYGREGNWTYESLPDRVEFKTYYAGIEKVDGQNTETKLGNVEFVLKEGDAFFPVTKVDGKDYYVYDSSKEATAANATVVTASDGTIKIRGLDKDKTYTLTETKNPNNGYNMLAEPVTLTLHLDSVTVKDENGTVTVTEEYAGVTSDTWQDVVNNKGAVLPSTGGIGTTIFYVVGGVLVLAAIILLVTKKRMSE